MQFNSTIYEVFGKTKNPFAETLDQLQNCFYFRIIFFTILTWVLIGTHAHTPIYIYIYVYILIRLNMNANLKQLGINFWCCLFDEIHF